MAKPKPKFKPGDRVAERPKATIIPNLSTEVKERIAQYRSQRYGTVIDTFTKVCASRGKRTVNLSFVRVLWDGHKTPSDHAQMRLCHEEQLSQIVSEYCAE